MKTCCEKQALNFRAEAKYKIEIQAATEVLNDYGSFEKTWATESTVWAIIEPKTGRESFQFGQQESEVKGRILIRYQSALKDTKEAAKRRVLFDSRVYEILSIRNLNITLKFEGKHYQELLVSEV